MLLQHASRRAIDVDGHPLAAEVERLVEALVVEDDLRLPDMVVLRLRDPGRDALERAGIRIGSELRVRASAAGERDLQELIVAEVTGLGADFDGQGSRVVVRGYDRSHRLTRGVRTESYRNVTDSDIARTVARRAGLDLGQVDETATIHALVSQLNVSDWDFLRARARGIGFVVVVAGGRLSFRAPDAAAGAPPPGTLDGQEPLQLVFGADLEAFRPRVTSMGQVGEVEVRGWDPAGKEVVVGTAPPTSSGAALGHDGGAAAAFGSHRHVTVDRALAQPAEVDALARATADDVGSSVVEAEGVARGNPRLRAGRAVSVGLVGDAFEGRYLLTASRHVFDARGYRTAFTVSGGQERSLLGLASLGATNGDASATRRRIPGVVSAIVTGVEDPDALGRVKLRFPWLSDSYESDWARVATIAAGDGCGAAFLPDVGDEVLVAFEHGEIRRPYVLAALHNGVDRVDLGGGLTGGGRVTRRGVRSAAGHTLVFVEAGGAQVELTARGDLVLRASGRVELSGARGVSIDGGSGQVELKGVQVRVN